jgi:hypothetical protein
MKNLVNFMSRSIEGEIAAVRLGKERCNSTNGAKFEISVVLEMCCVVFMVVPVTGKLRSQNPESVSFPAVR